MPKRLRTSEAKAHLRLKATVDVLSDAELMHQIRRSRKFCARGGKGLTFEAVFGEPLRLPKRRAR